MTDRRRTCPMDVRPGILDRQGSRCAYCRLPFGSVLRHHNRTIVTSVVWDHRVPFAYLGRNPVGNWRAACATCNAIKSDKMFINLLATRNHILDRWIEKGFEVLWTPETSSEEDPQRWAVEFARYLTNHNGRELDTARPGQSISAFRQGQRVVFDNAEVAS